MTRRADRRSQLDALAPSNRRRLIRLTVVRSSITVTVLTVLYFILPLGEDLDAAASLILIAGLTIFIALVVWHVQGIFSSPFPSLRAAEALATSIPLFLLVFASTYFLMGNSAPDSFSQVLTRLDSLYFTITVFSTVGFGDITPTSETTRVATMIQMLLDAVLIAVLARVLLGAARLAKDRRGGGDVIANRTAGTPAGTANPPAPGDAGPISPRP